MIDRVETGIEATDVGKATRRQAAALESAVSSAVAKQQSAGMAAELAATTIGTTRVAVRGTRRRSESPTERRATLEFFYDRHAEAVYTSARWMCGSAQAHEITKLVFLDVWRQPGSLNPADRTIRTRMIVAVYRHATQQAQAGKTTPTRGAKRRRTATPFQAESQNPDSASANALYNALDQGLLSANQRYALALTQFGQCSYHEIARLMNESEHSILVTLRSALHHLHGPLLEAPTPTY